MDRRTFPSSRRRTSCTACQGSSVTTVVKAANRLAHTRAETYARRVRTRRVMLGMVAAAGIAIGVAWGLSALAVYVFFVAVAAGLTLAAGLGGEWVRDVSSRRFDDRGR
jgi:hypothetical protein